MPGVVDALLGEVGLTVAVLVLLAYTVYENRRGAVAQVQSQLKALGVITYRLAKQEPDVDEEAVRQEVFTSGGDSKIFPSDFDVDEAGNPTNGKKDDERRRDEPGARGDD